MPRTSGGPAPLQPCDEPPVGGDRSSTIGPAFPAGPLWMWAWVIVPWGFLTDRFQQTWLRDKSTVIFAVPVAVDLLGGVSAVPTRFVVKDDAPAAGVGELGAVALGAGEVVAGVLLAYPPCQALAKARTTIAAARERRPRLINVPPRDLLSRRRSNHRLRS